METAIIQIIYKMATGSNGFKNSILSTEGWSHNVKILKKLVCV